MTLKNVRIPNFWSISGCIPMSLYLEGQSQQKKNKVLWKRSNEWMKSQSIGTILSMRERSEVLCSALHREREREGHARVPAVRTSDGDVAPFCDFFCTHHGASSVHSYFLLLLLEHRFVSEILKFIIIIIIIISSTTLSNCFKLFGTECINHPYNDLQTSWPESCQVEEELVKFFLWYRVTYMVPQETRSTRVLT